MKKDFKIYIFLLILIVLGLVFYFNRVKIKEYFVKEEQIELPAEIKFEDMVNITEEQKNKKTEEQNVELIEEDAEAEVIEKIKEVNLAVPFIIQSPDQKWEEPYKEGCEEASILMAQAFLNNQEISVASALKDIGAMVDWQLENYGGHFDLPASTTVQLAKAWYPLYCIRMAKP